MYVEIPAKYWHIAPVTTWKSPLDESFGLLEGTTFEYPVLDVANENHSWSVVFITDPYLWLNWRMWGQAWVVAVTFNKVISNVVESEYVVLSHDE